MTQPTPVLMLHGLTGVPAEMQAISRHLRRGGYEVETPMLRGHGVDEATLLKTGWRDWCAGAEQDLLDMTKDGGKAFVGGLSVGAVIALWLAQKHPDRVKGVISLAATVRYDGWSVSKWVHIVPFFRHVPFLNQMTFKEHPPYGIKDERLRARVAELLFDASVKDVGLPSTPGLSMCQNLDLVKVVEKRLDAVTCPVLICHAIEDDITHIRNAERIAAGISGPVRKVFLEDSYHLITVDRERAKVAIAVLQFCQDVDAGLDVSVPRAEPAAAAAPETMAS